MLVALDRKDLNFDQVQLINFSFVDCAFCVIAVNKSSAMNPVSMSCPKSFIAVDVLFTSSRNYYRGVANRNRVRKVHCLRASQAGMLLPSPGWGQ